MRFMSTIHRKILFGYILLIVVPLGAMAVFSYEHSATTVEDKAEQQFEVVSEMAALQFDQYFKDIENLSVNILQNSLLQQLLNQEMIPAEEWTTREIQLDNEAKQFLNGIYKLKPGISSILIYGFNGQHYYYHPTRRWDENVDGTKAIWYEQTIELNGRWRLSGKRNEQQLFTTLDPNSEEVVTFSRMINDLNTFEPLGVLSINVQLKTLEQLAGITQKQSGLIILDEQGKPIVTSMDKEKDMLNSEVLEVSTLSPFTGWTSVYFTSKEELFKETRQVRDFFIIITLMLLVVALASAGLISTGIVRPIRNLREQMKKVSAGNFSVQLRPAQADEVGELTVGFNRMVKRIKRLIEEIKNKEEQRRITELDAMQARINPHFMYNTLNGIRWVAMMDGNEKVTSMITSLVHLLRFSSKNKEPVVSIQNEIELLQHYVKLMKMRNDQFDLDLEVQPGMAENLVIPFILQPIVENSIFHGIIPSERRGRIRVKLRTENDDFNIVVVEDNGVGMNKELIDSLFQAESARAEDSLSKVGFKNVYDRLKLQFGEKTLMEIESEEGVGTRVVIQWPVLKSML